MKEKGTGKDIEPGDEIYSSSRRRWIKVKEVYDTFGGQDPYVRVVKPGDVHFYPDEPVRFRSGGG